MPYRYFKKQKSNVSDECGTGKRAIPIRTKAILIRFYCDNLITK